MNHRIRAVLITALAVVSLPAAAWALTQPRAVRAHLVSISDFRQVGERVFVSPGFGSADEADLARLLREARARVEQLFGGITADPSIIVAADEAAARLYSPNLYAATYVSPFGAYVVLGPKGLSSLDVVSHELAHAEHLQRVGYLRWSTTPAWFIEGLAMQADHRAEYSEGSLDRVAADGETIPLMRELGSVAEFGRGNLTVNYAAARREVSRVRERLGPAGLSRFLDAQRIVASFDEQLERALADRLAGPLRR